MSSGNGQSVEGSAPAKLPVEIGPRDILFECPLCEKSMVVDQEGAGQVIDCPQCFAAVIVPYGPSWWQNHFSHFHDAVEQQSRATERLDSLARQNQQILAQLARTVEALTRATRTPAPVPAATRMPTRGSPADAAWLPPTLRPATHLHGSPTATRISAVTPPGGRDVAPAPEMERLRRELTDVRADFIRLTEELRAVRAGHATMPAASPRPAGTQRDLSPSAPQPAPAPAPPRRLDVPVPRAGIVAVGAAVMLGVLAILLLRSNSERSTRVEPVRPMPPVSQPVAPVNLGLPATEPADSAPGNAATATEQVEHALAMGRAGQAAEALEQLRAIVAQHPEETTARFWMATLLNDRGDHADAVAQYRELLRRQPDYTPAVNNLADLLATHPDPKIRNGTEALALAQRACERDGFQDPLTLDTMAAAYAELGRFTEAVATAERAQSLAAAAGQRELAQMIALRLAWYQQGLPYRS
jgi:TolA-binding protein